jgi:hypothetical protein
VQYFLIPYTISPTGFLNPFYSTSFNNFTSIFELLSKKQNYVKEEIASNYYRFNPVSASRNILSLKAALPCLSACNLSQRKILDMGSFSKEVFRFRYLL